MIGDNSSHKGKSMEKGCSGSHLLSAPGRKERSNSTPAVLGHLAKQHRKNICDVSSGQRKTQKLTAG